MAYKRKPYESARPRGHDRYVAIYESMYTSPAWKALTPKQIGLYLFCRFQIGAKNRPGIDYPDYEPYQCQEVFYMNWAKVRISGLYGLSKDRFYQDMKTLCTVGLIERLLDGRGRRVKSVYRFSDLWQKYKAESAT